MREGARCYYCGGSPCHCGVEDEQEALRRFARATAPPKETVADRYYKARRAAGRHRGKKRRSA